MKWEYKTVKLGTHGIRGGKLNERQLEDMLNHLGEDGWELVAGFDTSKSFGETQDVVLLFKRMKQ